MNWSAVGALGLGLAVMLGAFGEHTLKDRLDAYQLGIYEKAVFYHFIHALGILIVSIMPQTGILSHWARSWICAFLLVGIIVFCGSLYVLAVTGIRAFGLTAPIGGLAFIAGWLLLGWTLLRGGYR